MKRLLAFLAVLALFAAPAFAQVQCYGKGCNPLTNSSDGALMSAQLGPELAPALTGASWTCGAGWDCSVAGTLNKNADGLGTASPAVAITPVVGTTYRISITLGAVAVGNGATYTFGATTGDAALTAAGTYTHFVTVGATNSLVITPTPTTTRFTITAVSVRALVADTGDLTVEGSLAVRSPIRTRLVLGDATVAANNNSSSFDARNASGIHTELYNNGRLELTAWGNDGGIALLTIHPVTATDGNRAGHYAFRAYDDTGAPHTVGRFHAYIDDVTRSTLDSRLVWDYMANVDGTGTYAYPNKEMSLSSSGLVLPDIPFTGATAGKFTGILTLDQNGTAVFSNTASVERGRLQYDGAAMRLQSASGFAIVFRPGDVETVRMESGQQLRLVDPGAKPTCAAGIRGSIWYDAGGAGVADTFELCAKASADTYAWRTLVTVP